MLWRPDLYVPPKQESRIWVRPDNDRSVGPTVRVDAAARIHERIAGPIILLNALPPLAPNELFGGN
jgi:hypothetical protein